MQTGLIIANVLVWGAVLVYGLRLVPPLAKRWNWRILLVSTLLAAGVSAVSYQQLAKAKAKPNYLTHYYAGLDERNRGNLQEAEKELEKALALKPGDPKIQKELQEIQQQRPAEKREHQREVRVEPVPSTQPNPNQPFPQAASNQTPPGNAPPTQGKPGEKPKPAPHKASPFEITHYALDVAIDPAAHRLDGTATIRIRSRGEKVARLEMSLNPEFKPSAVTVNGAPVPFEHPNDLLAITPAKPLAPNGEATLTVTYTRSGPPLVQGGDLIHTKGTYLRSEARWYPATGELDFRSPVSVRATVPSGFSVVSVGALKELRKEGGKSTFHWETDRYASMVSLAAAKYVQKSVVSDSLKITCYTFPQHADRAAAFLKEAGRIVRFYEQKFGPYPYEKLAVVEIPMFPGGYGTTSFVMLIDKSFEFKKIDREFLAHEIAHQWWGNMVFPQGLGAAWLTEAFANYSAWMYDAAVSGNPRYLKKRVKKGMDEYFKLAAVKGDQPIAETDPYQPLGAQEQIIYEKGAVILHMLRREIGDRAFFRTLRAFADGYRFGKAKIEDFRKIAERESGRDLSWFFDQWLGRTGGMEFTYTLDTEPYTSTENQAVVTVAQKGEGYRAKLNLDLQVENTVQKAQIELSQPIQTFRIPVKGKVMSVAFDPDEWYLMRPPRWIVPDKTAGG